LRVGKPASNFKPCRRKAQDNNKTDCCAGDN
jgi:hypothetical protein